ncbi:hypothetical protein K388_07171 [Streptomyces sp. KhCrAH-43]|uniref:hypothetical protein n=1 Tax=unclassified Streptomyces TaxID=2593676 RepID=UPI00037C8C3D|nr:MULTISPECIES: hypothetical protein [unclassified Streptomyces]MYS36373.1 hypothetical protein [Streptomyces sp. SID4920]MYX63936.1 hypothetical protein [Streptomyces sp. SID8373]RAJ47790.1 hypothetical protein K388_07171 [Streptomyces sp. KhCrAH-43]
MLQDELNASAIHQRAVSTDHFSRGDVVHVMATVVEARRGRAFSTYKIGGIGDHATGEPAYVLERDANTVRAPARYLIHQTGCDECAAFEAVLCKEITAGRYGDTDPDEVMLMARTADGQLLHVLDMKRLTEGMRG